MSSTRQSQVRRAQDTEASGVAISRAQAAEILLSVTRSTAHAMEVGDITLSPAYV
jgi:hypothetical protein